MAILLIMMILTGTTTPNRAGGGEQPEGQVDRRLQSRLVALTEDFHGDVGIYARHLSTGRHVAIRADELFPTASLIKVPILLALFEKINAGELDYHGVLTYHDSLLYAGVDLLGSFKSGEGITLSRLVLLMITMSDNTASLWCQELAGGGTAINAWLEEHGFPLTRVNSRTPGRHADWEAFGWGQTTPRELTRMLVMIREGRAVSPAASEEMYRVLSRVFWDAHALSQVPPTVEVASKQGAVNRSRSEVALVNGPSGDYVFAVVTRNQVDESWGRENEGFALLRAVSRLLWETFEPNNGWEPAEGAEDW
ncbi:MAG: serine hydrolase [Candidatus Neomarinimicrobiota bacterium]